MSFFDDKLGNAEEGETRCILFNYNINMQKWWVTVLDVFCQFLTAIKIASFT